MKNLIIIIFMLFSLESFAVMDKNVCADLITNALVANNPGTDPDQIKPYWAIICDKIIETVKTATIDNTGTTTVGGGSSSGTWPTTSIGVIQ